MKNRYLSTRIMAIMMAAAMVLSMVGCGGLEDQKCFAVIGATIADNFQVEMPEGTIGTSLLGALR